MAKISIFIFAVLVFAVAVFNFTFIKTTVKGSSMYPTLNSSVTTTGTLGDTVYINRFNHGDVGDIVVAKVDHWINLDDSKYIIKRLIGLPGDEITIKKVQGEKKLTILCNNEEVFSYSYSESSEYNVYSYYNFLNYVTDNKNDTTRVINAQFIKYDTITNKNLYTGTIKLKDGEAFIMGDNMSVSHDSTMEGPVQISNIIGRVDIILDSQKSSKADLVLEILKMVFNID